MIPKQFEKVRSVRKINIQIEKLKEEKRVITKEFDDERNNEFLRKLN